MKAAPALAFDVHPSRAVARVLIAVSVCAMLAPWLAALPAAASAGLSLCALMQGGHAWLRHRQRPFRRIAWRASGWTLVDAAGNEHAAVLERHARLGALLALDFRHAAAARYRAVLAPDNLDAATRRRLTVLLARGEVVHAG